MTTTPAGGRHRSREVALQVLFALDVRRAREEPEAPAQEVFDEIAANFEMPEAARAFAKELVCGTDAAREDIDARLRKAARNWRLERMALVDRNILRLATYEMIHTQTPVAVVLNEAVQMAKRFADDPSPAFVNGVLDGVARAIGAERA